jgi:hypothetical protein
MGMPVLRVVQVKARGVGWSADLATRSSEEVNLHTCTNIQPKLQQTLQYHMPLVRCDDERIL